MSNTPMTYAQYMKAYRERHPEVVLRGRINSAVNLLVKHGYTVTPPADQQQKEGACNE